MSNKRLLFITHTLESCYGAATSLKLLLQNYRGVDIDIVVQRSLRRYSDFSTVAAQFPCVRHIYGLSLPQDLRVIGVKLGPSDLIVNRIHNLLWLRDRPKLRALLRRNAYDLVHLNSPVLHRVIVPEMPAVCHMRDIVVDSSNPVVRKLASCKGIVFIDSTTRRPFERVLANTPNIILNNPFDMRDIASHQGAFTHPRLSESTTVFSVIGRVSEIKGVEMIVRAFRAGAGSDTLLLVVGSGPADYIERCRTLAGDDPRVAFLGEEPDIKKIYAATDFVVRGDPQGCVGRTVYEGLYAGCSIILPGLGEPDFLFEAQRFAKKLVLYPSRDVESLAGTFAAARRTGRGPRTGMSNVDDYVRQFDSFLDSCL